MGFWLFMLAAALLVPLVMIGFGSRFLKSPPAEINPLYGYRTAMSMKNKDTWAFAHRHCGRLWRVCGWCLLFASAAAMLWGIGRDISSVGILGLAVCMVQLAAMLGSVVLTEAALKKQFDASGNRYPHGISH